MPIKTRRSNPNALSLETQRVLNLERYVVRVGWSTDMGAAPETVAIVAINAFGAPEANIPARPVLPSFIQGQRSAIRNRQAAAAREARRGRDPEDSLWSLSYELASGLEQAVRDYSAIPNAESTAAQKGFNDPLIGIGADGGRIAASANSIVIKR